MPNTMPRGLRWIQINLPQKLILGAILAFFLIYPGVVKSLPASRFSQAIIYAIIGLSVNILMGYAGQVSLGHQAFVGIGAFTAAYMVTVKELPFPLAVLIAALVGAVTSAMLGLVALRVQGLYLALVTLAYGTLAERSLFSIQALTGGGSGQAAIRPGYIASDGAYAYLCMFILAALLFVDWRMLRTKFGRALIALKNNEQVAASFGMNLMFYKVGAFVITGTIAGIGGALLAFRTEQVVAPDFDFALALTFVIMVVVGGLGSRTGVVIGSMFVSYLPTILDSVRPIFGDIVLSLNIAIGAALLLLNITRFPGGLAQQLHPLTEWLSGKPFPKHHKPTKPGRKKKKASHGAA
ncbi:MAG: branched-chain amino acid ABC transporter permease [Actinomycetota bacterium]